MLEIIFDTPTHFIVDGKYWSHISSNDVNYLHEIAIKAGLKRKWFQDKKGHPHYDTYSDRIRAALVKHGAKLVDRKTYATKINEWHKRNPLTP